MKTTLLFFFVSIALTAQEKRVLLYGKVLDSVATIKNAHVVNLTTKQGTFTNEDGDFRIYAKEKDTIQVSSIGFKTLFIFPKSSNFGLSKNYFYLKKTDYELDEVIVKNTELFGILTSDVKTTPKDIRAEALEKVMDFSDIDMKAPVSADHIDSKVRPPIVQTVPNSFSGVGGSVSMPFKDSERLWALRRELEFKTNFPAQILNELGEDFFFKELQIPIDRFYHFLEYCNPIGIEKLYQDQKTLDVIKILKQEHVEYLKIIKKE